MRWDERWAPSVNIAAASQDWKALASDVLSKLCMETIPSDQLYAYKDVVGPPRLWTLKAKLTPETGEKMLCASGQQGVFVRPLDPSKDSCASQYTIVWGPKHIEASAQELALLMSNASKFVANRGIARSLIGLGLRVRWGDVHQARTLLRPKDPSLTPETLGLKDQKHFRMHGVPSTASVSEMARFCSEIKWRAIPQSRVGAGHEADWFLTAEEAPSESCYRWGKALIYVEEVDDAQIRQVRTQQHKRRAKATACALGASSSTHSDAPKPVAPSQMRSGVDPWTVSDPWSSFKPKAASSSAAQSDSGAKAHLHTVQMPVTTHKVTDDRVDAVMVRLDALEAKQVGVDSRLDKLDGNVESLGVSMSKQFTAVLRSIEELATLQRSQDARKRQATAPFGSDSSKGH